MKLNIFFLICLFTACNTKDSNLTSAEQVDSTFVNTKINSIEDQSKVNINIEEVDKEYSFDIQKIDSTEFQSFYVQFYTPPIKTERISNFDSIQSLLKEVVNFQLQDDESLIITKIHTRNGKDIDLSNDFDLVFITYFPTYDFLLLESTHSSDDGYNLTTGNRIFIAGNPNNEMISPNQKFRISGIYGGQDCIIYIIQKFTSETNLERIGIIDDIDLCYFRSCFWVNDNTFYYSIISYRNDSENGEAQYYRLNIRKRE